MNKLKTVNIKGKEYVEVNERLKHFRENYENWCLTSDVVELTDDRCVIKATIFDENGNIRATGHAYEKEGSNMINQTSALENCETSAWGRALANFGIGIDTSVASANEVRNAKEQQESKKWLTESQFQATLKGSKKEAENVINLFRMKKEYKEQIINKFKIK